MPDDITNVATTWASVSLTQNETWQVILGQIRLTVDTAEELEPDPPLQSGLLLRAGERINLNSADVVRYRRASVAPVTIGRTRR